LAPYQLAEAQEIGQEDDERLQMAQSKQLRAILDAAEARIRATGGIRHEYLWNQLDAECEALTPDSMDSC
jgi:hypothetical protein